MLTPFALFRLSSEIVIGEDVASVSLLLCPVNGDPVTKPVLYLQRDGGHWTAVSQGRQLGVVAASDVKLEDALRMARAAYADYDVRVCDAGRMRDVARLDA